MGLVCIHFHPFVIAMIFIVYIFTIPLTDALLEMFSCKDFSMLFAIALGEELTFW